MLGCFVWPNSHYSSVLFNRNLSVVVCRVFYCCYSVQDRYMVCVGSIFRIVLLSTTTAILTALPKRVGRTPLNGGHISKVKLRSNIVLKVVGKSKEGFSWRDPLLTSLHVVHTMSFQLHQHCHWSLVMFGCRIIYLAP